MVKHARYRWLLLAESHLTRRLFARVVRRIEALAAPAGYGRNGGSKDKEGRR